MRPRARVGIIVPVQYIILIVALAVTCFAGVQFFYLMFVQATNRQQRRRIAELERELAALRRTRRGPVLRDGAEVEEVWAEVIDDAG